MKKIGSIVFFLTVAMTAFLHEANAQPRFCGDVPGKCPWVLGGEIGEGYCSSPMPLTVRVYDGNGLQATANLPSFDYSNYVYTEVLIWLPQNFDINNVRITGQLGTCDSKEYDIFAYTTYQTYGIAWDQIAPGGGTSEGQWEFTGVLYQFSAPVPIENCDVVTLTLPTHLSLNSFFIGNESKVSWKIADVNNTNSVTLTTSRTEFIDITTAQMKAWFGSSFQLSSRYTVTATDENLPPLQSISFRMRSKAPQLDFSSTPQICTTQGHLDVNPSSINISSDVPEVQINSYQPVLKGDLPNVKIHLDAGTYRIQIFNHNPSDADDNCYIEYYDTSTPYRVGPSKTIGYTSYSLSLSKASSSDVTCKGSSNGSIDLAVNNGSGPFIYAWSSGQNTEDISGIPGGSYSVSVSDANQCTGSLNGIAIGEPLTAVAISQSITSGSLPNHNGKDISCLGEHDGEITISGSGGTSPYSYSLDGGTYQSTTAVYGGLLSGIHGTSVKDAHGCIASSSIELKDPDPLVPGVVTSTNPTCYGGTGQIKLNSVSGGTGPFTYSVSPSLTTQAVGTPITSALPNVTYTITAKDANNCTASAGTVMLTQPAAVSGSITPSSTSFACYNTANSVALDLTPSGGNPGGYNFSWTTGAITEDTNITLGTSLSKTYTVTITDTKLCSGTTSATVTQPPQLALNPVPSLLNGYNIWCKGGSNGSIGLTVTGGTPGASPPYTYSWTSPSWVTPQTTQNLSGLSAGSYSVTVKDGNNCSASASVTMTEPPTSVSVLQQSKSNLTCFGLNDGKITVTASGGVGALKYKDSTATSASAYQLNSTLSSLTADTHFIRAKDLNGCVAITPGIIITSPPVLSITLTKKTDPDCYGASTGVIQVSATGGTSPYTFSDGGASGFVPTSTFSEPSGSYIIAVKDATNICTASLPAQVLTDPLQIGATLVPTPQSCSAIVDGKISVTNPSGGAGAFTYSISSDPLQTGPIFTGLAQGTYTVTIKDSKGCSKDFLGAVGIVPALSGNPAQTSFINCFGQSTAALSMAPAGGTSPYSYSWSTGAITQNVSSLPIGNYSVVVTDSKSCSMTKNINVTQPALLTASATGSSYNGFGVSCQSYADGFINLTVNGGSSPYTYAWSNGANTKNISALATGNYSVTVTDSKGCTANQSQLISSPTALALTTSKTNVMCNSGNDGSITANASGGAGAYLFSIDGGANWQSGAVFTPLTAGSYTIQAKDQNTCPATAAVTITQPTKINISIGTIQNAACGQADGSIQASAGGGTGTLSYSWSNSSNLTVGTVATLSNVSSGTYILTVLDQNNCMNTQSASVSNPSGPVFSIINQVAALCSNSADGGATVSVTSGVSPFSVSWGDGEMGTIATKLMGGNNTVTVTDGGNCLTTQNFTVAAPAAIALSNVQTTVPTCPSGVDGAIQITATGGTGSYSYKWNNTSGSNTLTGVAAGNYDLQVTDAANCKLNQVINLADKSPIAISVVNQVVPTCSNTTDGSLIVQATGGNGSFSYSWNTGAVVAQLNSIGGGDYVVTAKDNKNCTQQKTITISAPAPVLSTLTPTSVKCHGGSNGAIQISATGGTGTYSYSDNNGNTWQTQSSFTSLIAGNYTIQTKDQNGCITPSQTNVSEPAILALNTTKTNPTCNQANGLAQVTATGGTGSYSYQWTNSLNQTQSTAVNLTNAFPDTYTVAVTDANNCTSTATVIMNTYPSAQFTITNIGSSTCSYSTDGAATLQILSGQAPYTQVWSSNETTTAATKLPAGQNTITVTDVNGCSVTKTFQVPSPPALTAVKETVINPVCSGGSDGSIQVLATGGTGALSYVWNGTVGSNAIQNVKAGTYNLIIKDASNCTFTKSYSITDPIPFAIDLGPDVTICPKTTTQIGLTLPNATYSWSGPNGFTSTAGVVNVGDAGTYLLKLINAIGCQATDDIAISISNNLLKSDFLMVSEASVGDTIIVIDISWPVPDQVEWHLGDSATVFHADNDYALISYTDPGTYTVGVKATMGGCSDEYTQHIIIDKEKKNKGGREESEPAINTFIAYPNPFEGRTNVGIVLSQAGSASIKVYSLSTNLLIVSHQFEGEKNYDVELDLSAREAGVYIIVLEAASKTKSVKVIKL